MKTISRLILNWAATTWGPVARDPAERAARLLEEAAETAQAFGVTEETAIRIVKRTYSRPVGEGRKELGGVLVCAHGLAAIIDADVDELLDDEIQRVLNKPVKELQAKHDAKVRDGTGNVSDKKRCICEEPKRMAFAQACRNCGLRIE